MKSRINIVESQTEPKKNELWLKDNTLRKFTKDGWTDLLPEVMESVGGSGGDSLYEVIRKSGEKLGWGSIVNAIINDKFVSDGGCLDLTDFRTVESIKEVVHAMAEAALSNLSDEEIRNLPYDDQSIGVDKIFTIPVNFIGVANYANPSYSNYEFVNSRGSIHIVRGEVRDSVILEFFIPFNHNTIFIISSDGGAYKGYYSYNVQSINS